MVRGGGCGCKIIIVVVMAVVVVKNDYSKTLKLPLFENTLIQFFKTWHSKRAVA